MATSIRLAAEVERRLDALAGRTKAYYLREIIERGLEDMEGAQEVRRPPRSRRAGCFVEVCGFIAGGDET